MASIVYNLTVAIQMSELKIVFQPFHSHRIIKEILTDNRC